ncbi:MAG: hypothetical protein CM15mP58_12640 [Burkholderiaceae bacterium]|nr:MAG: hypothetical protein CM15mP58_12640 [Burkholderiaceae bacterium]
MAFLFTNFVKVNGLQLSRILSSYTLFLIWIEKLGKPNLKLFPFDGIRKAVFVIEKFCEPYNHKPLLPLPILKFVSNKILLCFFDTSIKNPLLLRNTRIPSRELSQLFRRFQSLFLFWSSRL